MKKIILFALLSVALTGCKKDEETEKIYSLDISALVNLIDKTPSEVKDLQQGNLVDETKTLNAVELTYDFPTTEIFYQITFKTNSSGIVNYIKVFAAFTSASDGLNYFKPVMDKCQELYADKHYYGMYYKGSDYPSPQDSRSQFWESVTKNQPENSDYLTETWILQNGEEVEEKFIFLNLKGTFFNSPSRMAIEIIKSVF